MNASAQRPWVPHDLRAHGPREAFTGYGPAPVRPAGDRPPVEPEDVVESDVPARLDRLPWAPFHTLVVIALGVTWILDGLEVTLAGALSGAFKQSPILRFSNTDVGFVASTYLAGAVLGALYFGWLTDRWGRRRLFFMTLVLYLTATAATAVSWDLPSFALFRFLAGAGIGGEYTAINSAIQELVPARYRGRTDLAINGSYWLGAAVGAAGSVVLLDPAVIDPELGWRLAFFIGAGLGLIVVFMRMWIPESPRWLLTHGHAAAAQTVVVGIEDRLRRRGRPLDLADLPRVRLKTRRHTPLIEVVRTLFGKYRSRTLVGLSLMACAGFLLQRDLLHLRADPD